MNYQFYYSGQPGNISATLSSTEGSIIAQTTGLRSARAAKRWAKGEANLHKQELSVPTEHTVEKQVYGNGRFSI